MKKKQVVNTLSSTTTTAAITSTLNNNIMTVAQNENPNSSCDASLKLQALLNLQEWFQIIVKNQATKNPNSGSILQITAGQITRLKTIQKGLAQITDENIYSNIKNIFSVYAQHTTLQQQCFPEEYDYAMTLFGNIPALVIDGFDIGEVLGKHLGIELDVKNSNKDRETRVKERFEEIKSEIPSEIYVKLPQSFISALKEFANSITCNLSPQISKEPDQKRKLSEVVNDEVKIVNVESCKAIDVKADGKKMKLSGNTMTDAASMKR